MYKGTNIFGEPLKACSNDPVTGFFRDGCCNTGDQDFGMHTVCAVMTDEFLAYSKERGNDLSTPRPQWNFPGLKEGDRWCLCAAPPVKRAHIHPLFCMVVSGVFLF